MGKSLLKGGRFMEKRGVRLEVFLEVEIFNPREWIQLMDRSVSLAAS